MVDTGRSEPLENVISLVSAPIAAVIRQADQMRRGADEVMRALENFNATMENLNETAARINRLLNDFEEPVRAMLPQVTRAVRILDDMSSRLSGPVDQVAPGLVRLAETLNSPVLSSFPRDLSQFVEIINDLGRRMSPLAQIAEQAGGMFGLRIPGFPSRSSSPPPPPHGLASHAARDDAADSLDADDEPPSRPAPARRSRPKKAAAKRPPAKKSAAGRAGTKKAAAKRSRA